MSIAQYLTKFALGVNSQGVLSAAKGGTGSTSGGGGGNSPTISGINYTGDDTATLPAGGATITLTGTNFGVGVKVLINNTQPSVLTRVSATQLTFTAPAMNLGTYPLYVINSDGGAAILVPGIEYSNTPTWTTASGTLGSVTQQVSFNASVVATGDAPITYSIASGALPSGLAINSSTGAITGTAPAVVSTTTYTFTVRSTDAQLQDTDRVFSITVVPSNVPPTVEYLVVAGGGSGGGTAGQYSGGGGGGAGGYRSSTLAVLPGPTITVTVGAGGTASSSVRGTSGSDSVFGSITSIGGGAGAYSSGDSSNAPTTGGSGGGGGYDPSVITGAAGTAGQGNAGGNGNATSDTGGGGGGAGAIGGNGNQASYAAGIGGAGGAGSTTSISGSSVTYAGGGGGGCFPQGTSVPGAGGSGGGGNGGTATGGSGGAGVAGAANTGGGGGGASPPISNTPGGNGGSGVVIIRYSDTYAAATATTGSPTITTAGGYRVYQWTSSGSITF